MMPASMLAKGMAGTPAGRGGGDPGGGRGSSGGSSGRGGSGGSGGSSGSGGSGNAGVICFLLWRYFCVVFLLELFTRLVFLVGIDWYFTGILPTNSNGKIGLYISVL
jgi:hypothetical protein